MNYYEWEMWFIKLGNNAGLRQVDINSRSISEWKSDYDNGMSPVDSLNAFFGLE